MLVETETSTTMPKRLPANTTNGIHVRLKDELLLAVEDFSRHEADIPSKPEAVRRRPRLVDPVMSVFGI